MNTIKNKVENPKNDTTAATPKHKPLLNPTQDDLKKAGLLGEKSKKKPVAKKPAAKNSSEDKKNNDLLEAVKDYDNARRDISARPVTEKPEAEKTLDKSSKSDDKKEDTAVTMSTDAFSKEILTEFHKRTKAIKSAIGKIDTSFETIAFNLHWINAKQAYKSEGHATIIEYAAENFGYQKSTCYSLISVVDRFAKRDEKGALMEAFEDRVKGFSVSKLSLMVNLTDAEVESLKPTMSVRDIKKFVKGLVGKPLPELSEGDGESPEEEGETSDDEGVVDVEAVVVSNTLIECLGKEDYEKKVDRIDEYIMRVFKKHPEAVISVSYSVPVEEKKKG